MEKIRNIQVVNVRWFNATAWYALFLARLLKEAGHATMVLCLPGTACFSKAQEWGLDPVVLPLNSHNPATVLNNFCSLRKIIHEFKPQIINCHRGESFWLYGLLKAGGSNFGLVRTRGDQRQPKNNLPNRFLHSYLADAVIATNSRTLNSLRALKAPPEKLHLIPGGVDDSLFYPDAAGRAKVRAELGYGPEDFVIGLVGRFDSVKGHSTLIQAVQRLLADKKNFDGKRPHLLFLGFSAGISEEAMLRELNEAGIAGLAHLSGRREDIRACINAMDLGVLASLGSEAIARAAVEIIACGVPLLSTNVGIMPDILPSSLLLPPARPDFLSASLAKAMGDAAYLDTLHKAGQEALGHMKAVDFLEQTMLVYQTILNFPAKRS